MKATTNQHLIIWVILNKKVFMKSPFKDKFKGNSIRNLLLMIIILVCFGLLVLIGRAFFYDASKIHAINGRFGISFISHDCIGLWVYPSGLIISWEARPPMFYENALKGKLVLGRLPSGSFRPLCIGRDIWYGE